MAAPTKTTRITPSGEAMKDGFKSLITFSLAPAILLWERSVTPSGRDGGEPIPYSSMHNTTFMTQRPRSLRKGTDLTMRCGYDPTVFGNSTGTGTTLLDYMINVEQTITQFFPSTAWCAFFGYLRMATYNEHTEGSPPEVTITITPTFWDYTNKVEAGPAYGTGL